MKLNKRTYRHAIIVHPPLSGVFCVPQTDLAALQVRGVTSPLSTSDLVKVKTVSPRVTTSVPPLSASICVAPATSSASSSTSTAVSITHTAVAKEQRAETLQQLQANANAT